MKEILNLEIVSSILPFVATRFDSHKFICEFIYHLPTVYGNLLIKHDNVATAHSEIAKFLAKHSSDLNIQEIGEAESPTIFGKLSPCAQWKKVPVNSNN